MTVVKWAAAAALLASVALVGEARTQMSPPPGPAPRMMVAPPRALAQPRQPIIQGQPLTPAGLLPATQTLFDGYVRDGKMPGIVGAFGYGDLPTIFVSAGRVADADAAGAAPAGPDSLWRVYSMTKPITALAAMILIEQGKIGLDDPVAKYIPAFVHMKVLTDPEHSMASRPAARPITIRNLLTHTAGLGYNIITKGPLLKEYDRLGINPAQVNAKLEPQMRSVRPKTLEEFADRVATLPLIADPGTKWSYSIGLDVMGRVIEVASGMPFDRFVNLRIFQPLGMRSSYWTVPSSEVGRLVTEYAFVGANRVPFDPAATSVYLQPPSFPYGGAGLVMSARDYDRFLHLLQDGGRLGLVTIIKPETAALMMSNLLPEGVVFPGLGNAKGTGNGGQATARMGYGAGGSVYLTDGPGGFPAKGTYGWGGAAGTTAFVDPAHHFRGTVMVNYFPGEQWPVRQQTVAALMQDLARLRGE